MSWATVLAAVIVVALFFVLAKKGGCCGMKGKDSESKDGDKKCCDH